MKRTESTALGGMQNYAIKLFQPWGICKNPGMTP